MALGFQIELVWADEFILELRLSAAGNGFSGSTFCYAALSELEQFAHSLTGFPLHRDDVREYSFGEDAPGELPGGAMFRLTCADGSGHLKVVVRLWSKADGGEGQSALIAFRTLPGELDRFVDDLASMGNHAGACAHLAYAT
jgi:hypothetical protein